MPLPFCAFDPRFMHLVCPVLSHPRPFLRAKRQLSTSNEPVSRYNLLTVDYASDLSLKIDQSTTSGT